MIFSFFPLRVCRDRDKRTRRYGGFIRKPRKPRCIRTHCSERPRLFISIHTLVDEHTPLSISRRDPLLIGGSYERDDRQVEISYRWLSAHYANIHSESQPDILSRSCLSRFAKAFLRPCLSLSLLLSPHVRNCCLYCTYIYIYVYVGREVVPFLDHGAFRPIPDARPLSRNHIRICDHVTAYRLDFVSRDIYAYPSLLGVVKRFSNRCSCHAGSSWR